MRHMDQSGYVPDVLGTAKITGTVKPCNMEWPDLPPFMQGYIEALLTPCEALHFSLTDRHAGFSDLAPETLGQIIADCERFSRSHFSAAATLGGKGFWTERQVGGLLHFPALTVQLADDGKVRFG